MKQRITNAKIVNEGSIVEGDLVIDGDRIEGINTPPSDGEAVSYTHLTLPTTPYV